MTIRRHMMPFGAEIDGSATRFRLWAPDAKTVELVIEGGPVVPLDISPEGWCETRIDGIGAGARYRYRIDGGLLVPDPASRFQPDDVHSASEVIDPAAFVWSDDQWRGRPWAEAVLYETHMGAFTPQGSFASATKRLDYLVELGVTAIELMPVADFPGRWNWGYDGVAQFAPDASYGRPEDLKRFVQEAHGRGLMVFLDVVYNHFGPEGNYLHAYAERFFTDRHHTPWGKAINFDGPGSSVVRDFFFHNAMYWLEEFHIDGLRFDAVHAIIDETQPHFLTELASRIRAALPDDRLVHLVLENDANQSRFLARDDGPAPNCYDAQWNDDIHHVMHVLATGENGGYYQDYDGDTAISILGRCLTQGFAYQGEASAFRDGEKRGEPSAHLPPTSFVSFLQNHDQIGNRAMGERIESLAASGAVRALTALFLMAPSPPLLFMGEEWGTATPFLFFCDFSDDLAEAVRQGRRREFARFPEFASDQARARIPDPNAPETFQASKLNWAEKDFIENKARFLVVKEMLRLRALEIAPRLKGLDRAEASFEVLGPRALRAQWRLADGSVLHLLANLGAMPLVGLGRPPGRIVFCTHEGMPGPVAPWMVAWTLEEP